MKWEILTTFLVASLTQLGHTQEGICRKSRSDEEVSQRCREKETCHECIIADPCCAWCREKDFGGKRCDYLPEIEKTCRSSYTFPTNKLQKIKDSELSSGSSTRDPIQIKPQKVSIKVKPNTPLSLKIKYKQTGDYPLDLYYLMDLSYTMEDDKENLAKLGDKLAEKMKRTTRKFQIGFGSFVDKVTPPFVDSRPNWIDDYPGCAFPYSFRNHMALNADTRRFKEEVKAAQTSINKDLPEGTLDALMQAISCQKEINWRGTSRKLIVLATDATYHLAGDGKLGGIVQPNDGKCHLNASGHYTEGTRQDYPSISQIRNAILEHNIIVIFAVNRDVIPAYKRLSGILTGSTVGQLEANSSNIVEMIEYQYSKIKSSVTLMHCAKDPIKITFYSSCLGGTKQETNNCDNIGVGENVTFEAKIEITSCPEDRNEWNQTFHIYPLGLNERLTVDLRMLCECDCEKPWNQEKESDYCSDGRGTYECGICKCDRNRLGKRCQCEEGTSSGTIFYSEDTTACFKPNDTVECSGRGKCVCGYCECLSNEKPDQKTTGQYCECDNFSCDRHNGQICGGPNQGVCECGKCKCLPGWKGNACQCRETKDTCTSLEDEEVCSGHGVCECGKCVCKHTVKEYYTGKFCEECVVCPGSCERYKACVQCKAFQSGLLTEKECEECSGNYTVAKELQENRIKCYFEDDDGCRFIFTYEMEDDNSVTIEVQEEKECPEPVNVLAIILGVTGGIVAIGILTLLAWKILTFIHDSREYAKFLKQRNLEKWMVEQNPLYKKSTSTFKNPLYGNTG